MAGDFGANTVCRDYGLGAVPSDYEEVVKALADANGDGRVGFEPKAGEAREKDDDDSDEDEEEEEEEDLDSGDDLEGDDEELEEDDEDLEND